jgi:putative addiction module component (TIGR02574 family)
MSKAERLLQEALELPPRSRGRLAASLIQSLDERSDPDAEASWTAEIDRRLDDLDAGKAKTVPWRKVERGLLKRRRAARRR